MATLSKFNAFVADIHNKVHNLGSDTLKVLLTNVAPVATNSVKADLSGELSTANGYTAGGATIGNTSSTQSSGTYKLIASGNTVWTATGAVGPFRYAAVYNNTAGSANLIGWLDYGSSISLANTDTFTIQWDGTNGIFSCT